MDQSHLLQVINEDTLPKEVVYEYLRLYVAEIDWEQHISKFYKRISAKYRDESLLRQIIRKTISCTILLRAFEPSVPLDKSNPESLLFRVHTYHQFNDRDWFVELQKVIRRDLDIQEWRKQALALGVVDKIEFQPYHRQAFNWIFLQAEEGGFLNEVDPEIVRIRLKKLVQAYGGSVICNIFTRHSDAIKRVLNWRSGYFLERQIFQVYTIEQVLKIKRLELDQTNVRLIKKIAYR